MANGMTATERATLEWLGERPRKAYLASKIADWIDCSLPKVNAALQVLKRSRLVAYFPDHPGTWAVTPKGQQALSPGRGEGDESGRYLMALEAIIATNCSTWDAEGKVMKQIARTALRR